MYVVVLNFAVNVGFLCIVLKFLLLLQFCGNLLYSVYKMYVSYLLEAQLPVDISYQ